MISSLGLKKAYSCSENQNKAPLVEKSITKSINFDNSFRGIEIDLNIGGNTKKDSCGDRFIPCGISEKAYSLMGVNSEKKETNLVKKTSTEFYQEYLCSHILSSENSKN